MTECNTSIGERGRQLAAEHGHVTSTDAMMGCSEEEIREIEEACDVALPETYRSFLEHMGKGAGNFLLGCDCFYPKIRHQKEAAEDAIQLMDADFEFGDGDFVFMGLQGHSFWFFNTLNGDDPPVYHYMEGDAEATKESDSFSEWLFEQLEE